MKIKKDEEEGVKAGLIIAREICSMKIGQVITFEIGGDVVTIKRLKDRIR